MVCWRFKLKGYSKFTVSFIKVMPLVQEPLRAETETGSNTAGNFFNIEISNSLANQQVEKISHSTLWYYQVVSQGIPSS
jgi:hypothetical protein